MCVICGMNKKVEIKVSAIPYIDNENVCSDCVGDMIAFSLIQIENEKNYPFKDCKEKKLNILTPREIKAELDKRVIGQEDAKKTIAVAIYNHYKRIANNALNIQKSNVLMVGPTGVGKTEIARSCAKILDVPFAF